MQCAVFSVQSIIQGSKYSDPLLEGLPQASMPEIGQRIRLSKGDILQVGAIVTKLPRSSVYDDAAWDNDDPYDEGDDDHDYNENYDDPILDTRISVLLLLRPPSVTLRGPPLDSETGWTGELWLNCVLLILEN